MNYSEFRSLVTEMRKCQRMYFKTRNPADLEASKRAEREVDRALAEYDQGQRTMFEEGGQA